MRQEEIQGKLRRVMRETGKLLSSRPDDADLLRTQSALAKIQKMISQQWPLSDEDKQQINIGMYANRVLEGGPYGRLPDLLMELDSDLSERN